MSSLVLKRLLLAVPSLIGVVIVTFLLTRALPGDPAAYFAGPAGTKEAIEQIRVKLGLDRSLPEQFVRYVAGSRSRRSRRCADHRPAGRGRSSARDCRRRRAHLRGLILAIRSPSRSASGGDPAGSIDRPCLPSGDDGRRVDADLLPRPAPGLRVLLSARLCAGAARAARRRPVVAAADHRILVDRRGIAGDWPLVRRRARPARSCRSRRSPFSLAPLARMTRASHARGARLRLHPDGAGQRAVARHQVVLGYAFRNAMLPVLTTLGMVFSFMLGANVLVEKVFAWPGIGAYAVDALLASDFAPVQGFVLAMALLYRRPQPHDRPARTACSIRRSGSNVRSADHARRPVRRTSPRAHVPREPGRPCSPSACSR